MGILSTIPKFKYNETYFNVTLKQILVPRWAESLGHISVIEFLVDELEILGFVTKRDEFGDLTLFTNVIGIMNPSADKFIILTCHFDTKYMDTSKEEDFIGATDGGVSCAIILNVIRSLNRFLLQEFSSRKDLGLVLAFFVGHESVEGKEDNTYPLLGSNHFIQKNIIPLDHISVVITLNLIGAPDHIYMSRYERTLGLHEHLGDIEQELTQSGQLSVSHQLFYKLQDHFIDIEDDHYPFLNAVWQQIDDNIEHLHWPSVRNMNIILTQFLYACLKL